jgi:hypothetical protein
MFIYARERQIENRIVVIDVSIVIYLYTSGVRLRYFYDFNKILNINKNKKKNIKT